MRRTFDLKFVPAPKDGIPHPPVARMSIRSLSTDEQGLRLITPDCVSVGELEGEVRRLQAELEDVLKTARKKFK